MPSRTPNQRFLTFNRNEPVSILKLTRVLPAILLSCSLITSPATLAEETTAEQQKKFEELRRSIEKLKNELEKTKSNHDSLQNELEKNERTIQELDEKTDKLRSSIKDQQSHLKRLDQERSALQQQKLEQTELVEEYLNSAYRLGKQNEIKLLFNQKQPSEVTRMLRYFQAFSESRQEKIAAFVSTLNALQKVETEIAFEKSQLEKQHTALQTQKQALASNQKTRLTTLQKLEASLSTKSSRLTALESDRKRLQSILNAVYQEINAQELELTVSEFRQLKGRLPRPTKGKIINRFGATRASNGLTWQGLEFQGEQGADIIAIHHGQVVFSDYLRGHGLLIVVDHGSGFMSLYAHAANLYKELGEWVAAGEVIASVGNTGGRRDSALYFELRHNGKPTNPSAWFTQA